MFKLVLILHQKLSIVTISSKIVIIIYCKLSALKNVSKAI
jgi:hypothetical protein